MNNKKLIVNGTKVFLVKGDYQACNQKAVTLVVADGKDGCFGEDFAVLTVCDPDVFLMENEILVKTWSENSSLRELLDTKYFCDTMKRIPMGFCEAEIWSIVDDSIFSSEEDFPSEE